MILANCHEEMRPWFAWHPVSIDCGQKDYGKLVWLRVVWRSRPSYKYPWFYAATPNPAS